MNLKLAHAVLVAASALSGLVACGSSEAPAGDDAEQDLSSAAVGLGPVAAEMWKTYTDEVNAEVDANGKVVQIQKGCQPIRVPASTPKTLGVVVLFHGYTACPQQFMNFERSVDGHTETAGLASRLSKAGYDVLLPLLPGHGRMPKVNPKWTAGRKDPLPETEANRFPAIDDSDGLPAPLPSGDQLEGSKYTALVRKMNAIMAKVTPPNRVVGGISVGAVLATQATIEAKEKPYTRALIAAPFYQAGEAQLNLARDAAVALAAGAEFASDAAVRKLVTSDWKLDPLIFTKLVQSALWKKLGESPLGWGAACELTERKIGSDGLPSAEGRAGICQFKVKHLAGVLLYGKLVEDKVASLGSGTTNFQVTGVVNDPVVNNREVGVVVQRLKAAVTDQRISFCVYKDAAHSMFSWHDASSSPVLAPKAWIPPLESATVTFLTNSTSKSVPFVKDGTAEDKSAGKLDVCSVK